MPKELEEAVRKNELIVFVGAGLSYNLLNIKKQPLGGWSNLVLQILLHLKEEGYDVDHLITLVPRCQPIKVLDLIDDDSNLPKKRISDFIKDFLDLDDENEFNLHKKLYQLSSKIITTNYDTAFEKAIPELRKNRAYKGKNYELTKHKEVNASLLFKLHGCFEDADSMVLFPQNYKDLYENTHKDAEHSILVLKNIILNKSILFVGTGMGDFQINNLFKEIKNLQGDHYQKHYIITKTALDSSLHFLTAIQVNDYTEIESVIDHLITIKENCINKESEEVKSLKEQLEVNKARIKELESEINPDQTKLLEREALKYFSRGLNFSLSGEPEKSVKEYEIAVELKPDLHEAFNNWGNALGNLAQTKDGAESEALYEQEFEKFQKAIEIKPDYQEAFYNWGTSLGNLAKTKGGAESEALYEQAFEKFQKAIEIKPDDHEVFNNWGTYLANLAQTKGGAESEALYEQAFEKFQKAIEIKPDDHEVFNNWGAYIVHLAQAKGGAESEALYKQAFEKFQKAIEIKPDDHEVLNNWGAYLVYLAQTKKGAEFEALCEQALGKHQKAIAYGGSHYNLACLYAIKGEKEMALKYLETSLLNKDIEMDFILNDEDWKNYYEDPDFITLMEDFKKRSL